MEKRVALLFLSVFVFFARVSFFLFGYSISHVAFCRFAFNALFLLRFVLGILRGLDCLSLAGLLLSSSLCVHL